jgi:hypothetical protein
VLRVPLSEAREIENEGQWSNRKPASPWLGASGPVHAHVRRRHRVGWIT